MMIKPSIYLQSVAQRQRDASLWGILQDINPWVWNRLLGFFLSIYKSVEMWWLSFINGMRMTASWMQQAGLPVRIVLFLTRPNPGNGQIRAPEQTDGSACQTQRAALDQGKSCLVRLKSFSVKQSGLSRAKTLRCEKHTTEYTHRFKILLQHFKLLTSECYNI